METSGTPGNIIASQKKGSKTGATKKVTASTRHEAIILFNTAKMRLLNINGWQALCGPGSAEFQITDQNGVPIQSIMPEKGNLIRISLPAPQNSSGSGYDWVRIEAFEHAKELIKDEESYGFRVRPVPNPKDPGASSAHFYTSSSTSTFLIIRKTNTVMAMERGRNEQPNTRNGSLFNKIRNFAIAILAMIGFAKPQWQSLMNGLLARD
jgi:hypothetical protein